ncbi:neuromodulin-like [Macrosteles quadrilineatus]|uniref:neuromodulin-like n=1 Tax=Macrosteles quadrilineatus TaxID=74068 RepID=UPI0023E17C9D|nr:neuromodulin-like [Macrosteles quadrilineatus]
MEWNFRTLKNWIWRGIGAEPDPEEEIDPNDPEAQKAAVKIQAVFRGHKTRKEMKTDQDDTEVQDFEAEFRPDDKELCHAATKIQASFRGHKVRKQAEETDKLTKEMEKAKMEEEEIQNIDLTDPELNKAATKIQASFRGHKVRKEEGDGEASGEAKSQ